MPDYRRAYVRGGTFFFTVKTERNAPVFVDRSATTLFGTVLREAKSRWPFEIDAIVLLPDHVHAIWSLPPDDDDYSKRWSWIKREFAKRFVASGGEEQFKSASRKKNRRLGVWQRRYWEHVIKDEDEFDAYFDYVHWNPVKHRCVRRPAEWPHSSFHRWADKGVYPSEWGGDGMEPTSVRRLQNVGE